MTDSEEARDVVKRGTRIVNREALNLWLRFGTLIPPVDRGDQRPLAGAELLRWAGQRSRNKESVKRESKE